MKHQLFLGAAAAIMALASCASDETVSQRPAEVIDFQVSTANATRADAVYCANNLPTAFKLYAATEGKNYINGDNVAFAAGKWTNTTALRYWPAQEVTFYGIVNGEAAGFNVAAPTTTTFTVDETVAQQKDLLYARTTATKADPAAPVMLNFRHALAQIVFRAKNTNSQLYVEISGVAVNNVESQAAYTLPSANTDANILDHAQATDPDPASASRGTWGTMSEPKSYAVTLPAAVEATAAGANLTDVTDATGADYSKAMLLLPVQGTTALVPTAGSKIDANSTGTYFVVKAKICNVAGSAYDAASDITLYDGDIVIPASFTWEQGKKYIYTFVFGNGNGGYNPDDSTPVLVPITYDCTVDDFVAGGNTDTEMKTND